MKKIYIMLSIIIIVVSISGCGAIGKITQTDEVTEKLSEEVGALSEDVGSLSEKIDTLSKRLEEEKEVGGIIKSDDLIEKEVIVVPSAENIKDFTDQIIALIDRNDFVALKSMALEEGVYFMPGEHTGLEAAVYIGEADWDEINTRTDQLVWGTEMGSGEEISLTPSVYFDTYISQYDFLNAPEYSAVELSESLKANINIVEDTIGNRMVTYHYPGFNELYEGMDYQTLILILNYDAETGSYKLVGIINSFWTI